MPQNRYGKLPQAQLDRRDVPAYRFHKEGGVRDHLRSFRVQRSKLTVNPLGNFEINQQKDYL